MSFNTETNDYKVGWLFGYSYRVLGDDYDVDFEYYISKVNEEAIEMELQMSNKIMLNICLLYSEFIDVIEDTGRYNIRINEYRVVLSPTNDRIDVYTDDEYYDKYERDSESDNPAVLDSDDE